MRIPNHKLFLSRFSLQIQSIFAITRIHSHSFYLKDAPRKKGLQFAIILCLIVFAKRSTKTGKRHRATRVNVFKMFACI